MKWLSPIKRPRKTLLSTMLSVISCLSLLAGNSLAVFAQGNTLLAVDQAVNLPLREQFPSQPFSILSQTDSESPAATINVCSLPGAMIDSGDLTYEGDDIQVIGCQGMINGVPTFNSLTVQTRTLVHTPTLTMSLTTEAESR